MTNEDVDSATQGLTRRVVWRSTREASLYVTLAAVRTAGGSSVISQFMESSHSAATRLNEPAASALLQPIRPERR